MSDTLTAADWQARHGKMPRLYVPAELLAGTTLALPDGPAKHVTRVLRMGEGAPLIVFDGRGQEAGVRLAEVSRKQTTGPTHGRVGRLAVAGGGVTQLIVVIGGRDDIGAAGQQQRGSEGDDSDRA